MDDLRQIKRGVSRILRNPLAHCPRVLSGIPRRRREYSRREQRGSPPAARADEDGTARARRRRRAELYGLKILFSNVEDQRTHERFFVVGRSCSRRAAAKTSLLGSARGTEGPGVLLHLLTRSRATA